MPNRRPYLTPARVVSLAASVIWSVSMFTSPDPLVVSAGYRVLHTTFGASWHLGLLFALVAILQAAKLIYRFAPWRITQVGSMAGFMLWFIVGVEIIAALWKAPGGYIYLLIAALQARIYYETAREARGHAIPAGLF